MNVLTFPKMYEKNNNDYFPLKKKKIIKFEKILCMDLEDFDYILELRDDFWYYMLSSTENLLKPYKNSKNYFINVNLLLINTLLDLENYNNEEISNILENYNNEENSNILSNTPEIGNFYKFTSIFGFNIKLLLIFKFFELEELLPPTLKDKNNNNNNKNYLIHNYKTKIFHFYQYFNYTPKKLRFEISQIKKIIYDKEDDLFELKQLTLSISYYLDLLTKKLDRFIFEYSFYFLLFNFSDFMLFNDVTKFDYLTKNFNKNFIDYFQNHLIDSSNKQDLLLKHNLAKNKKFYRQT